MDAIYKISLTAYPSALYRFLVFNFILVLDANKVVIYLINSTLCLSVSISSGIFDYMYILK